MYQFILSNVCMHVWLVVSAVIEAVAFLFKGNQKLLHLNLWTVTFYWILHTLYKLTTINQHYVLTFFSFYHLYLLHNILPSGYAVKVNKLIMDGPQDFWRWKIGNIDPLMYSCMWDNSWRFILERHKFCWSKTLQVSQNMICLDWS